MSSARQTLKNALLQFLISRDVQDLLRCTFTKGIGVIFTYLRGKLKVKHAPQLAVYVQRLKKFLGIFLPPCAVDGNHVTQTETAIVHKMMDMVDFPPLEGSDQIDGPPPPPPEAYFQETPLSPEEPWLRYHVDVHDDIIRDFKSE